MPVSKRRPIGSFGDGRALKGRQCSATSGSDVGHAQVRAAPLVGRAEQDVRADRAHVDRLVRRVVDRVDPGERARLVRQGADARGVGHYTHRVRGPGERHHAGALGELPLEIVVVERQVVEQVDLPYLEAEVRAELHPGRHAAVVVEAGHDDLIAALQVARERPGEREVERRHVRPEHDLARVAAEPVARGRLGRGEDLLDPPAGLIRSAEVAARLAQRGGHRDPDLVGHLRAARGVEEAEAEAERRKALPHGLHVELGRGRHRPEPWPGRPSPGGWSESSVSRSRASHNSGQKLCWISLPSTSTGVP